MKHIVLCADDYGQNTAISQAIIELLKKKRLSATSGMTNSYYWLTHAKWLIPFKNEFDIGLHFNLTEGKPLTKGMGTDLIKLPQLILKAYTKKLDQSQIEAELHAQIDQFIMGIGQEPDFIDGHQHIQQLPVIREAIFNVYEKRLRKTNCYIRLVNDKASLWRVGQSGYFKFLMIQLFGSFAFKKGLIKHHIPHNTTFSGIYNFKNAKKYADIFPHFLDTVKDKGIIMCHPGLPVEMSEDVIAASRYDEYKYLQSDQFNELCATKDVMLQRFK